MHSSHAFLEALTIVLGVAAITTVLFHRIRQPVVLGYILAGLLVGPHVPTPLVADAQIIGTLSELGVILLMFSIGLEFSLRRLMQVGFTAGLIAFVQVSLMVWLGFLLGSYFGWSRIESLFAGAMISTSSTTIVVKVFEEQNVRGKFRDLALGVQVVDDLIAVLILAALTATASGKGLSGQALAQTTGGLVLFLVVLLVVGILVVPRVMRYVTRINSAETSLVASIGICFAIALLVRTFGYSTAMGAFLAGALVSESGDGRKIERLVRPVKDMFGAIFFVSVGMTIQPSLILEHWNVVIAFTVLVLLGQVFSVSIGAFLTGHTVRTSIQTSMCLAQTGEFSFIIATLGMTLGVTGEYLFPVAVAVSALTTLATPGYIRAADPVSRFVDHHLPQSLQTFVGLYGSWLDRIRHAREDASRKAKIRKQIRLLVLDTILLAAVAIAGSYVTKITKILSDKMSFPEHISYALAIGLTLVLATPLAAGIVAMTRRLSQTMAESAFPINSPNTIDSAASPRRVLRITLQIALVLLVGIPLIAILHPFYPNGQVVVALVLFMIALGVAFWRSTIDLHGHVRAGTQVIAEVLAQQAQSKTEGSDQPESMNLVYQILPGLGEPVMLSLQQNCACIGKSLAEINLRGLTGATVLAIHRKSGTLVPTASEILCEGDSLAISGSQESLRLARQLLTGTTFSESR